MKNRKQYYMMLTGIGILTIVVLILVSSPSAFFSPMVRVIGNDLNKATENEVSIATKTDFSDSEQVNALPYNIGKWHGKDYDTEELKKALKANVVLLRGYDPETFTQPLFLTIVQSKTDVSFHGTAYCLTFQGYDIQEQSPEKLAITDPDWAKEGSSVTIPLDKLIATKSTKEGRIFERRLVLFFYVKGNQFNSDEIAMVQVQGLIPLEGGYEGTLNEEKAFLSELIPLLFEPAGASSQWHPVFRILTDLGTGGYVLIIFMLLVPLVLIVYPLARRRGTPG